MLFIPSNRILISLIISLIFIGCKENPTEPDTVPPVVEITSPVAGASLTGPAKIVTRISDKSGIESVFFLVDGDTLFIDSQEPFEFMWNVGYWADGKSHTIQVLATDKQKNTGKSTPLTVVVSVNALISVQSKTPADNSELPENNAVTFSWVPIPDASSYEITVSRDSAFLTDPVSLFTSDSSTTLNQLKAGTYFWRIRSTDRTGKKSVWSEPWSFGVGSQTWLVTLDRGMAEWSNSIAETADGGVIVLGPSYSDTTDLLIDMWLNKLSSSGKKEWDKVYPNPGYDYGNSVNSAKDGGFFLFGGSTKDYSKMQLVKTNQDGIVQWEKSFGTPDSNSWGFDSFFSNDKSTLSIGGYVDNEPTIIHLNLDGNVIWRKVTNETQYSNYPGPCYSARSKDDGVIVATEGTITKLNSSGSIEWSQSISDFYPTNITALTLGSGFVASFYFFNEDTFNYGLLSMSENGTVNWKLTLDFGTTISMVSEISENELIAVGSRNGNLLIAKLNRYGFLLSQKEFGPGSITNIVKCASGGFLMSGYSTVNFTNPLSDFLVIKTDKNGNFNSSREKSRTFRNFSKKPAQRGIQRQHPLW